MVKSSTVASSTPSQVKPSSKPISSATSSPHQIKQHAGSQQVSRPSQNQLRRKLSRKLELMPQLDGRAFPGTGVTNLLADYQIEMGLFEQFLFLSTFHLRCLVAPALKSPLAVNDRKKLCVFVVTTPLNIRN